MKKGQKHSEETKRKMSKAAMGKPRPHKGHEMTASARKKISEANKGRPRTAEWRRKNSEAKILNPNRVFKDTSIELKIEAELKKRGLVLNYDYYKQVPLCKVAIVDFYLPATRTVIQADGCYWHNCPICGLKKRENATEKDAKQNSVLTFNGFNVYRFWEHEINKDVASCIDSIELFANMKI